LSFDETDDFAHEGRYDLYLNSANYTDGFIKELWQWVQSQNEYKDKTTLLITVDHGRGIGDMGWRDHGAKTEHSNETWFAIIGPDTPAAGELHKGQYYNSQYAQTIASLLGVTYVNEKPVGGIISEVVKTK
jgi:arylsulfatase A-like enzyme